jgi:hypothetical protein
VPDTRVAEPVRRRAAVVATAVAAPVAVLLVLLFNRPALRSAGETPTGAASGSTAAPHTALPPVRVQPPPESAQAQRSCPGLVAALPLRLGDLAARPVESSSPSVLAWGEPPVVLRCGVPRPAGFVAGAPNVIGVNGVTWFVDPRGERAVWTVVDRAVYIEATVPIGYASTPIPDLSDAVTSVLRPVPLRPGR